MTYLALLLISLAGCVGFGRDGLRRNIPHGVAFVLSVLAVVLTLVAAFLGTTVA